MSIWLDKEFFSKINWLNKSDGDFGTSSTISILDPKISASTLSNEVVQDKEEAEASTQSIRIEDSLHAVTPSLDALEVHEISDISSSHIAETEEDIRISDIEEKFCCTSMQTFTGDFPLNSALPHVAKQKWRYTN